MKLSYFDPVLIFAVIPVLILIYNFVPRKVRRYIMLIANFTFFFYISRYLVVFLMLSILSIFFYGIKIKQINEEENKTLEGLEKDAKKEVKQRYNKKKKRWLIACLLFNIAFLFFFKYLNFFVINLNSLMKLFNMTKTFKVFRFLAPIGISYYTLQAISYMVDVSNGLIEPETNLLKLSLFMSFFPQIMEGPIAKYKEISESLYEAEDVSYKNFCFGYQRIFFGFFKKFLIADRLNILVKIIFLNYLEYSGFAVLIGIISYTILLYMEFSGTMDVVMGIAEIFNVNLPENFRQPFFAKNISEFWQRWHITLGRFLKDYVFYPVSLSKPLKKLTINARKKLGNHFGPLVSGAIALFAVWALNGLWHGAGWNFIFYGMFHFILILTENMTEPYAIKLCNFMHINRNSKIFRIFQSVKMTILVLIGEVFFRAPTVKQGFDMLKAVPRNFHIDKAELLTLGLDKYDYLVIIFALLIIFIISLLKEFKVNIRESIARKNIILRWTIYYLLIMSIIIFGAYGIGYLPVAPIYADF